MNTNLAKTIFQLRPGDSTFNEFMVTFQHHEKNDADLRGYLKEIIKRKKLEGTTNQITLGTFITYNNYYFSRTTQNSES